MKLNGDQEKVVKALNSETRIVSIIGGPGTGKTTAIAHWMKQVTDKRVLMTASTNKAVGVIQEMCKDQGIPATCMTIHSALGLVLRWDRGEQVLLRNPKVERTEAETCDTLLIDEISTLGHDVMRYFMEFLERNSRVRIIIVGDDAQIPFVGAKPGEISPFFDLAQETVKLTKVERFSDGPIQTLCDEIRDRLLAPTITPVTVKGLYRIADDRQMRVMDRSEVWDVMLDDFSFNAGDDIRYIAFKNATVEKGIQAVRRELYGPDCEQFIEGEAVQALKPIIREGTVEFSTDSLLTIDKISSSTAYDMPVWEIESRGVPFTVVKGEVEGSYKAQEQRLAAECRGGKKKWREFYDFVETFSWIRSAQGLTGHKSQGSTFDRVYINAADIMSLSKRDPALMNRLLLVAASRPRTQAVLAV